MPRRHPHLPKSKISSSQEIIIHTTVRRYTHLVSPIPYWQNLTVPPCYLHSHATTTMYLCSSFVSQKPGVNALRCRGPSPFSLQALSPSHLGYTKFGAKLSIDTDSVCRNAVQVRLAGEFGLQRSNSWQLFRGVDHFGVTGKLINSCQQ